MVIWWRDGNSQHQAVICEVYDLYNRWAFGRAVWVEGMYQPPTLDDTFDRGVQVYLVLLGVTWSSWVSNR